MKTKKMQTNKNSGGFWAAAAVGAGAIAAYIALSKKRPKYDFHGKVVLITGGSRGLGLVLARTFAAEGARIAICARDAEELQRATKDLKARGAEVFQMVCDVRNQNDVEKCVEKVCSYYGHIDVLVNNAGVIQVGPVEVQTREDFENAMAVHFWGPYFMMRSVAPKMRLRGEGKIINIASIGGKMSIPHFAPYCASKFALVGLSGAMRVELAKDGIDVTTVCPGLMRTGSHINAVFKGKNRKEYAWFSLANAFPLASVSAERAARRILEACRKGEAEAIVSVQAELAAKMNAFFPELTAEISALINRMLPSPGGIGTDHATGLESTSVVSPSILTALADRQSYPNNELKHGEQII